MIQSLNVLYSALSELLQAVWVAELYQQPCKFTFICLRECQILKNCNLQEVIVWFVLRLQQKSHLFFVFSRLKWDRHSQLEHCAPNYVWTDPAQLQFLQHACHWLEKLNFLIFLQILYVFEDFFKIKFTDFIVRGLEKALILFQFPAEMLRKLDSQIFEFFKIITVLDQQVRLEINNFLSHHTVPKVS